MTHILPDLVPEELVETPAAVVDLDGARANAAATVHYLSQHGLAWRPHVKTHKSLTLARVQLEEGARGLTVATLREAEVMAPLGTDLLLAHPPVGAGKERRLARFLEEGALSVALDSSEALETVRRAARAADRPVPVLVEIDVGMGRVGFPDPEEAARFAADVAGSPWTPFRGVLFYPGHIRQPPDEQDRALELVSGRVDAVLEALERRGITTDVVSGGSTPTLPVSHRIPQMTEVRAGTCIFHDRDTLAMGVCEVGHIAYHVLATVVSTAVPGQAVVDAGSKALAREAFRSGGEGFAFVAEHPDVLVRSVSEEHGILDLTPSAWRPRVGDRVRLVPNHVCVSVNLQDRYLQPADGGYRPVPIEARGRL
jgi:D-serine deaminase-like pyridoxal phosphate-dependent protein